MLFLCAVASLGLLMAHPDGAGSPVLIDVLRSEASQRLRSAIVHGGFVLVLVLELAGFAALAVRVGPRRTVVLTAMTFAIVGAGLLAASMIIDGLVTPAVAATYAVASPERQEASRALLVLIGASVRVLMPMGLAFQGAAAIAWGVVLVPREGGLRIAGVIAIVAGAGVLLGAGVSLQIQSPHILMFALAVRTVWTLTAGGLLWNWERAAS